MLPFQVYYKGTKSEVEQPKIRLALRYKCCQCRRQLSSLCHTAINVLLCVHTYIYFKIYILTKRQIRADPKPRARIFLWVSYIEPGSSSKVLGHPPLHSQTISRKLDGKWNSCDENWHPYEILAIVR